MQTRRGERMLAAAKARLADGGTGIPVRALLAILCAASALTLIVLGDRLTFFNDDWYILIQREGLNASSIFDPHNQHLIAAPVVIYKTLIELFGFDDQLPFRVLLAASLVGLAVAVFVFVRERLGPLLALLAAALLLFLGPAWEDLLWSFQIGFITSLAAGVAVLLLMQRDEPWRNATACVLLVVSCLFSDLGLPFIAAAAVAVLMRRRPSELWVPGVPAALFAAWWIGYGHKAESDLTLGNFARLPEYVLDSLASGFSSLTGLARHSGGSLDTYTWGRPLLALAFVGVVLWLHRGHRPLPYLAVVATAGLTFWLLAGANFTEGREPVASRYQLVDVTFLILIAAELFRGTRLGPAPLAAISGLALIAVGSNIGALKSGYDFMRENSIVAKTDLGALEITRGHTLAAYQLGFDVAHSDYLTGITAGAYFRETDRHGSPAYTPQEMTTAPPDAQTAADNVLAAGYQMHLAEAAAPRRRIGCRRPAPDPLGTTDVELPPGNWLVTNLSHSPTDIGVRRFAPPGMSIRLGPLGPELTARVFVPTDSVTLPWHLTATNSVPVRLCPV